MHSKKTRLIAFGKNVRLNKRDNEKKDTETFLLSLINEIPLLEAANLSEYVTVSQREWQRNV